MTRLPPSTCTRYPSSRKRLRSALRLNSAADIDDAPVFNHDEAAFAQLTTVRHRGCTAVADRVVGGWVGQIVCVGECDQLFKGLAALRYFNLATVDHDLDNTLAHGLEVLNAWQAQIQDIASEDLAILTTAHDEKHCFAILEASQCEEVRCADGRRTPGDLAVVDLDLESAITAEGDEPFGTAAERDGISKAQSLEIQGVQRELDPVLGGLTEIAALTDRVSHVFDFYGISGLHDVQSLGFG